MKIVFGFNDIRQDGMGTEAVTVMRAIKAAGVDVQPVHSRKLVLIPGYIEEFNPIFISQEEGEQSVEENIKTMVDSINNIEDCTFFSHFGSPNWACVIPYLRKDIQVIVSIHSITPSALKTGLAFSKRSSAFIAVSWEIEKKLRHRFFGKKREKIFLIPNAVETKRLPAKTYNKSSEPIKIIFFGRIEDVTKGCDKIPRIAKILKERGLNFEWDFYGYFHWGYEPLFYQQLKENDVEDVISYCGCLNPDEVPATLAKYDIMVMPSNHEGFGLALAEAMCVGLATVASRIHMVTDRIVDDRKEGFLCGRNDIKGFADAIYQLATDEKMRIEIGKAAREKIIREFSIEHQTALYKEMFDKLYQSGNYKLVKPTCSLDNYKVPEAVKPHILARILPLRIKKILKKII
jgi:glycosyltransferase involved in cell wall biosynthesis